MPLSLATALRIDTDHMRWWEWDAWAADEAHMVSAIREEFRSQYGFWRQFVADQKANSPAAQRKQAAKTPPKRARRARKF